MARPLYPTDTWSGDKLDMYVKFIDLSPLHDSMRDSFHAVLSDVINSNSFIGGQYVRDFEKEFAGYVGVDHCVGVANGTDALEIALESLQFHKENSEVIIPANTFIACAEAVTRCGLKPVFCDVGEDYTIDIKDCARRITGKTAAIMCVHLYGNSCDMDPIVGLAKKHGLKIVEDCSQAHGAKYKGKAVGSIGDISCFSFYPGKNLGALGDAGAVLTNSESVAKKVRLIANHGRLEKYDHVIEGRNSRLDNFQAGILCHKLKTLDQINEKRRVVANAYKEGLYDLAEIALPKINDYASPVWHLFVIRTKVRDSLKQRLFENGIETSIHYPKALTQLDVYEKYLTGDNPSFSENASSQILSLPMGSHLSKNDIEHVCKSIRNSISFLKK